MSPAVAIPDVAYGLRAEDYAARRHATCCACGSTATDLDADYCRRCTYVAHLLRAWGAAEVRTRIAQVEPTLERSGR